MPEHRKNNPSREGSGAPKHSPAGSKRLFEPLVIFWRNISYRKKTILYTSVVLYIFILIFGLLIYSRAVSSMNEISQESLLQRLGSLDVELKTQFSGYSLVTATLLLDNNFHEKLETCPDNISAAIPFDFEIAEYLNALCSSTKYPTSWELYFNYDRPPTAKTNMHPVSEAEGTAWFTQLSSHRRNIITWRLEPETLDAYSQFTCSLGIENRKTGNISAYFKMNIPLSHITASLNNAAKNLDGILLLCSQDGSLLWCSQGHLSDYEDYVLPYGQTTALEPVSVSGGLGERTVVSLDGGKYGYVVYSIQEKTSLLSQYMNFGRYFLLIMSLIIVFSLVLLRSSAGVIDGRIVHLTEEIKALDGTDLNYQADISSQDEVGELSRAFSELVDRIKLLIAQERLHEEERFVLEVEALQAQINPHFLFNTLSIINLLAREIEADNISQAVEALANFYRYSLHDGKKMITLRDELIILDNYLAICAIRYRNQLDVHKDIDPTALDYSIPKLILQPFCENAVFHGFSSGSAKRPSLFISVKKGQAHLLITIADNGDGMSQSELEKATKDGFAITNVHRRIQMLYGEECGVSVTSIPGEGTQVQLKLGLYPKST